MQTRQPILERAFDLAGAGTCATVSEIKRALVAEGYDAHEQLVGRELQRKLRDLIQKTRRMSPDTKRLRTELHQADPLLVDNMALLAAVFAGSGDCIKVLDLEGRLIFMSDGGKQVMEVDDFEALRGCPWPNLWKDEGNLSAQEAIKTAKAGRTARFFGEANTARGTPKFWDVKVLPILGPNGAPTHLLSISTDITETKEAEVRQRLLSGELQHRIKNTLAMVSAIASQTLQGDDIADRRRAFTGRIETLSHAHDILIARSWMGASVGAVVDAALTPHQTAGRYRINGPAVELKAEQVLSLTLALHELATNAAKYGALSNDTGSVTVSWGIGLDATFHFVWRESGGPKVTEPERRGFGSRMINRVLAADFNGSVRVDYSPGGLLCEIRAPLSNLNLSRSSAPGRAEPA